MKVDELIKHLECLTIKSDNVEVFVLDDNEGITLEIRDVGWDDDDKAILIYTE